MTNQTAQQQYSNFLQLLDDPDRYTQRGDKRSLTSVTLVADLAAHGLPLVTCKVAPWRLACKEMLWFLSSSFEYEELREEKCTWWDPWLNRLTLPYQRRRDGELRRSTPVTLTQLPYKNHYDAFRRIANELADGNYNSTRLVCNLWSAEEYLGLAVLPPCAYGYQLTTAQRDGQLYLDMVVTQRSADIICGVPANLAQFAMLLQLYSTVAGLLAGQLRFNYGDLHVYNCHTGQPEWETLLDPELLTLADDVAADNANTKLRYSFPDGVDLMRPDVSLGDRMSLSGDYKKLPHLKFPVVPVHTTT